MRKSRCNVMVKMRSSSRANEQNGKDGLEPKTPLPHITVIAFDETMNAHRREVWEGIKKKKNGNGERAVLGVKRLCEIPLDGYPLVLKKPKVKIIKKDAKPDK